LLLRVPGSVFDSGFARLWKKLLELPESAVLKSLIP
jgi:hypothetical protein